MTMIAAQSRRGDLRPDMTPRRSILWLIAAATLALAANALCFFLQTRLFHAFRPAESGGLAGLAYPVLMLALWFGLGYAIMRSLRPIIHFAGAVFLLPPILFTGALLAMHVLDPPNRFVSVFLGIWFIPVGYMAGGLVARRARSA